MTISLAPNRDMLPKLDLFLINMNVQNDGNSFPKS